MDEYVAATDFLQEDQSSGVVKKVRVAKRRVPLPVKNDSQDIVLNNVLATVPEKRNQPENQPETQPDSQQRDNTVYVDTHPESTQHGNQRENQPANQPDNQPVNESPSSVDPRPKQGF